MYNAHPYFPSKIWAKYMHYTRQNTVFNLSELLTVKVYLFAGMY